MKRFRLPRTAKAAIETWVKLPQRKDVESGSYWYKENLCPFGSIVNVYERGPNPCPNICGRMFPSLKVDQHSLRCCPCHVLSLNYVIKRAKEIIR